MDVGIVVVFQNSDHPKAAHLADASMRRMCLVVTIV